MKIHSEQDEETATQIVLPKPVDGMSEFRKYVKANIRYENLPDFEKSQVVKLEFTVSSTGNITGATAIKSPGQEFEAEALRLLNEGPDWNPGTTDGKPSTQTLTLRIKFTPPE